jgi:hypothetical protein
LTPRGYKPVKCHLDTGSSCNLIGIRELKKLVRNPNITKSSARIRDIQNKPIKTIGECAIKGTREGKKFRLIFQVISTRLQPLLSENACLALKLIRYDKIVERHQLREVKTFHCRAAKTHQSNKSKKTAPPKNERKKMQQNQEIEDMKAKAKKLELRIRNRSSDKKDIQRPQDHRNKFEKSRSLGNNQPKFVHRLDDRFFNRKPPKKSSVIKEERVL